MTLLWTGLNIFLLGLAVPNFLKTVEQTQGQNTMSMQKKAKETWHMGYDTQSGLPPQSQFRNTVVYYLRYGKQKHHLSRTISSGILRIHIGFAAALVLTHTHTKSCSSLLLHIALRQCLLGILPSSRFRKTVVYRNKPAIEYKEAICLFQACYYETVLVAQHLC